MWIPTCPAMRTGMMMPPLRCGREFPRPGYKAPETPRLNSESAPLLCYESFYGAGHSIACATGVDRVNFVIVGGLRPEVVDAHAEHRIGMAPVQPNVRFCRLAQVFWIRTIVHQAEMLLTAPRVTARPSDYGRIIASRFKRRPFRNPDMCGSFGGRRYLGDCWQRQKRTA